MVRKCKPLSKPLKKLLDSLDLQDIALWIQSIVIMALINSWFILLNIKEIQSAFQIYVSAILTFFQSSLFGVVGAGIMGVSTGALFFKRFILNYKVNQKVN